MAWTGEGVWFNPISGTAEVVNGVYCECWDCTFMIPHDQLVDGGVFFTKSEYRSHLKDKRRAYFARQAAKQIEDGMARTKEKREARLVWEGQLCRPTFFDIINGTWTEEESLLHLWDRVYEDPSDYL